MGRRARTMTDENQVVQMENVKIDAIVCLIWIQSDSIIRIDWQFASVVLSKRSGCALDAAKVAKIKQRKLFRRQNKSSVLASKGLKAINYYRNQSFRGRLQRRLF